MTTRTHKQPNCEDRIDSHLESRLSDLRVMLNPEISDFQLQDDGTLDTVIAASDADLEWRFDTETAAAYRDPATGMLDLDAFIKSEVIDQARDDLWEQFTEYGLAIDYVEDGTEFNPGGGYVRYQLSWGGPSDEFRFYVDADLHCYRIDYAFLDWFDGATRDVTDEPVLRQIFQHWDECGGLEHWVQAG